MKKYLFFLLVCLSGLLVSCEKDKKISVSIESVKFRKADIAGAQMLAIASEAVATRAEGDEGNSGTKALYKVSADGTLVEVSYTVDVEGEGDVVEKIKANLRISPGFIFSVGEDWLWLANCWYDYPGWQEMEENSLRKAINRLIDDFANTYHDAHGAHFLIRKSDGALFQWLPEQGSPHGMDDGYKQADFLYGWFDQIGSDLYVIQGGAYDGNSSSEYPELQRRLLKLEDKGSTLEVVNVLGDNVDVSYFFPGESMLGAELYYGASGAIPAVVVSNSSTPLPIETRFGNPVLTQEGTVIEHSWSQLLSVGGKLYLANDIRGSRTEAGSGKEVDNVTYFKYLDFYPVTVSGGKAFTGELIVSAEDFGGNLSNFAPLISKGATLSVVNGGSLFTFDPAAKTARTRELPEHYPADEYEYFDGIGITVDGVKGFWLCDLSKDAAEYVELDWSSVSQYAEKLMPGSFSMERYEGGSNALKYVAYLLDGTRLDFYVPISGAERGKVKTVVGGENNAGVVVSVMVRLN